MNVEGPPCQPSISVLVHEVVVYKSHCALESYCNIDHHSIVCYLSGTGFKKPGRNKSPSPKASPML